MITVLRHYITEGTDFTCKAWCLGGHRSTQPTMWGQVFLPGISNLNSMLPMSPTGKKDLLQKGADSLPPTLTLTPALGYINSPLILKENILCFEIEPDQQTSFYHEPINVDRKLFYQGVRKLSLVLILSSKLPKMPLKIIFEQFFQTLWATVYLEIFSKVQAL